MQMNGFILHSLDPLRHINLSSLRRKFIFFCTLLDNPSKQYSKLHMSKLNQFNLLSNPSNLRGLTLTETLIAHTLLLKTRILYSNIFFTNNLIDTYTQCGQMDYAFKLFDEIPEPNLVTWNLMILGCTKNSIFNDSWRVFCQMHRLGVGMDEFTYCSVLSGCSALERVMSGEQIYGLVMSGEQIYGLVMKNGLFSDGYVRARMIDLFAKTDRIEDALKVLYDFHCENVVCWNAIVSGAVKQKKNSIALEIFTQMCRHGSLIPTSFTFSSALTACAAVEGLDLGKSIHGFVIKCGEEADVFVCTTILDFYAKCRSMGDALKQFKLMAVRDVVSWTAIISGFVNMGDSASAFSVLNEMRKIGEQINNYTVTTALAACSNPDMLTEAMQIHCWILKIGFYSNSVVKASLIYLYSKLGAVNLSEVAFFETQDLKQLGIWNNMISAYAQNKIYDKSVILFQQMLKLGITPDQFSTSSILSIVDSLTLGRQLHVYTLKAGLVSDISVGTSILSMYSKCGNVEDSIKAFEQLEFKDNIAWTSMIAGLAEHGCADKAVQIFRDMHLTESMLDELSLTAILTACSNLQSIKLGREIHGFSIRNGFVELNGALVNMYSKCGDLNSARTVFHTMPVKDHIALSSLLSGFTQNGLILEALQLFRDNLQSGMSIDYFTISVIFNTLDISNKSGIGTQLHVLVIKTGLESEASVGSSLIMMYSKYGNINDCGKVFEKIINPDLVIWTTMIASYAHHGKSLEALKIYELMKKFGVEPDSVTFIGVLSACSHAGLVEEGYFYLNSMIKDYGIEPGYKHYTCMVDILGRVGRLDEAVGFISNMAIKPDILVWETLLASCRVHSNHEVGKLALEKIMELQPLGVGAYVSMSNIWADVGEWGNVVEMRSSMNETGVKKEAGWSYL